MQDKKIYDCVIAGAGYSGLSLAVSLKQALPVLNIALVDPRNPAHAIIDERASAIAAAGRRLFQVLDVWSQMKQHAQPIHEMIITDSDLNDTARPVYLTFDQDTQNGEPFGHMVPNKIMVGVLYETAQKWGLTFHTPDRVTGFHNEGAYQTIHLSSGLELRARLLVAADGVRSALRQQADIQTVGWQYGQSAIVATIAHTQDHHGRAEEHFLPAGPFAVLPLLNRRVSLVWTEASQEAERLIALDEESFCDALRCRIGHHLGELSVQGTRQCFPLGLLVARAFVKSRFALLGDAAHGIHPIAGQGLNLGLRDVAALSEVIVGAMRLGQDFGALDILQQYQTWRRFDTVQMGITTDILNRLFSNNFAPLRLLRTVGLGLVDRSMHLKRFFADEAAGFSGSVPRLLRGQAL